MFSQTARNVLSRTGRMPINSILGSGRISGNAPVSRLRLLHQSAVSLAKTPFLLADIGEGITECELIQWFVKEGDVVEQFTPICEVQSDKAAVEISSRYDGIVEKLYYATGDLCKVGSPLVDIQTQDHELDAIQDVIPSQITQAQSSSAHIIASSPVTVPSADTATIATPAVRRLSKEHKVNLGLITGTGPNGRILKGDVISFVEKSTAASSPIVTHAVVVPLPPSSKATHSDKTVNLSPIQKAMFKAMTKSLTIPHFGFSDEVVLDAAQALRKELNAYATSKNLGFKITLMPIFLKALSVSLAEFPILNAQVQNETTLLYRSSHNIGIAMDTPQGLLVPNIKNVQNLSIIEVATEMNRLKALSQKGQLAPSDLSGGTFTLSNIGNIGGTILHPVLVTSQVCIGAIGKSQKLPRFDALGNVVSQEILNVSFNADHRVIDGATLGRFVRRWKDYLEHHGLLMATMK